MSTAYAFVFARGGSKGLPGKNVRLLAGKPLLHYAVETARAAAGVAQVFVSTDDLAIAEAARAVGAEIIDRPGELATDTAAEWLSWRHAVRWVEERYGAFDTFLSVPATTPLRSVADVERVLARLAEGDVDVALAVTPSHANPYFNLVGRDDDGTVNLMMTPAAGPVARRQDAPQAFEIAGSVYATTPAFIGDNERLWDGRVAGVEVPRERAVDIDELVDFLLAEALLARRRTPPD